MMFFFTMYDYLKKIASLRPCLSVKVLLYFSDRVNVVELHLTYRFYSNKVGCIVGIKKVELSQNMTHLSLIPVDSLTCFLRTGRSLFTFSIATKNHPATLTACSSVIAPKKMLLDSQLRSCSSVFIFFSVLFSFTTLYYHIYRCIMRIYFPKF